MDLKVRETFELNLQIFENDKRGKTTKEIHIKRDNLVREMGDVNRLLKTTDPKSITSHCAILSFYSYSHNLEFKRFLESERKNPNNLAVYGYGSKFASDPADIDWNVFGLPKPKTEVLAHIIMSFIFFIILPAITYYIEKGLSSSVANTILKYKHSADKLEKQLLMKSYEFIWIRVAFSAGFSLFCTKIIEFYYSKKRFRTHSGKEWSFYLFFNIYYFLNQIVADFYGIISMGIENLDKEESTDKILTIYYDFIFGAAFKVCLLLIITPIVLKVINFLPKIYKKLVILTGFSRTLNINKVRSDLPVQHNLPEMASFIS